MTPLENALQAALLYAQNMVNNIITTLENIPGYLTAGTFGGDGTNLYTPSAVGGDGTNLYTGSPSSNTTVTHNHTWNIGSVDSKETADYLVDQVIQRFTKENDIHGA